MIFLNFKGITLILLSFLAAVYTMINGGYRYIAVIHPTIQAAPDTLPLFSAPIIFDSFSTNESVDTPPKSENKVDTDAAIGVMAEGEAVGKIVSEFLSPYTANTSYNKVYLKNSTNTGINIKELLESRLSFNIEANAAPQVLIMHTHTTESFILHDSDYYTANDDPRSLESDKNLIAIGDVFEKILTDAGIGVIHDTTVHDHPSYSGSYNRSASTVVSDLAAYPTVKVVIDIHRDSITRGTDKIKPIATIDGKDTAQVMLVMGSETGGIKDFPKWQENLKLAVKYQQKMEEMYPGLARSIMLNSAKYNQNFTVGSILLEVGSEANTLNEAKRAAELSANALAALLTNIN